jgi:N-acetylglucosamine kinase-like BadF-type ATPase
VGAIENPLIIGVDGGGTRTRAVAMHADGRVLARTEGSGLNFHNIGWEAARTNLLDVVQRLLASCGATEYRALYIGMSALDAPADSATLSAFCGDVFDKTRVEMHSDAYAALVGATLGKPGMIVICGTGAMTLLLDGQGRQHARSGWGAVLEDPGSAFALAVAGLRASVALWEECGARTSLAGHALEYFGAATPRALIDKLYTPMPSPPRIAQFARVVLAEAVAGDAVAGCIVRGQMDRVARQCVSLLLKSPEARQVALYGGVFQHNAWVREYFADRLCRAVPGLAVSEPRYPPDIGAALSYLIARGGLTPAVLDALQQTYQAERLDAIL